MDTTNKLAEELQAWLLFTQKTGVRLPERPFQAVVDDVIAALAAQATQAVSEPVTQPAEAVAWRPIESAPTDGTNFLGYRAGRIGVAYRVQRSDCETWHFNGTTAWVDIAPGVKPTHWMPLPSAPNAHPAPASASEPNDYAHTLLPRQLRSWAEPASDHSETIPRLMLAAADALERDCASASAAGAGEALREPMPDDILTVANIEPVDGGSVLTLLASDLGDLVDIVGEEDEHYLVHITGMKRADFEALGEFDGF